MIEPYVIAINAVAGGGKTTLATMVSQSLHASLLFCFDDFDATSVFPDDYYEWWKRGANLCEFDCPGMREAVDKARARPGVEFIVLDYPFGRDHPRFKDIINLSVFIDTPLDVAMARRILRDYRAESAEVAAEMLHKLREEAAHYLEKARFPYLDADRHKAGSDLIVDGCRSPEELMNEVIQRIPETRRRSSAIS
jgi:uridine kinase